MVKKEERHDGPYTTLTTVRSSVEPVTPIELLLLVYGSYRLVSSSSEGLVNSGTSVVWL